MSAQRFEVLRLGDSGMWRLSGGGLPSRQFHTLTEARHAIRAAVDGKPLPPVAQIAGALVYDFTRAG